MPQKEEIKHLVGDDEDDIDDGNDSGRPIVNIGAPPWIVTFADLTTLMLTFFVLLLSFANMDAVVFRQAMGSMNEAFGVTKDSRGIYQLVAPVGSIAGKTGISKKGSIDKAQQEKDMLADFVADAATKSGLRDNVKIFYSDNGIDVRITDSAMFNSGKANLKKKVIPFLESMAKITRSFNFTLIIEGHTDNIPIRTRRFPSNWELSTVRATTVLRKLLKFGVPPDRLAAVGYADQKPLRDNNNDLNRSMNRRVEFKFVSPEEE